MARAVGRKLVCESFENVSRTFVDYWDVYMRDECLEFTSSNAELCARQSDELHKGAAHS